jgi:enoyl-CoA hydratase/carnithine racemase
MEMLLTSRYFSARETKELGLVNRAIPIDDLENEAGKLALQIAEANRYVLARGKRGFYDQIYQLIRPHSIMLRIRWL